MSAVRRLSDQPVGRTDTSGVRIDAGAHGVLSSPESLIDGNSGEVVLRLFPVHLQRLHPAERRGSYVPCGGDSLSPYTAPLLLEAPPVDVMLRPALMPHEVAGGLAFEPAGDFEGRAWWRWIAAALTPFGWVLHPTPHFTITSPHSLEDGRLTAVRLSPSCESAVDAFAEAERWLVSELGAPHMSRGRRIHKRVREWRYDWGRVYLWHEPRDGEAEVVISWGK